MEPVTLAAITSALTVLANEAGKGAASEAGKALWQQVQRKLGWSPSSKESDLASKLAQRLLDNPSAALEIVKLLQAAPVEVEAARSLVGSITADKIVVVGTMNVEKFDMGS